MEKIEDQITSDALALVDEQLQKDIEMVDRGEHQTQGDTTNVKKRKQIDMEVEEGGPLVEVVKGQHEICTKLTADDSVKNHTTDLEEMSEYSESEESEDETGSFDGSGFDQEGMTKVLCRMIIIDELPFKFVEGEGFQKFIALICPQFIIPCIKTVKEGCIRLFLEHKQILKSFFREKDMGRVSITADCWTSTNNTSYICVSAHFIGENWDLHKKVISFRKIVSQGGDAIADSIIESLNEWDLKNVLCCTVNIASANERAVQRVHAFLDTHKTNIMDGKYLHLRCVTHIINSIVSDCLEEIGMSVRRVREAVKWIKASPKRNDQFLTCVKALPLDCKNFFSLDMPTRWNSTCLMLRAVEPYEAVFNLFREVNDSFVADLDQEKHNDLPIGPPEAGDWNNVRNMLMYLNKFYELTRLFSDTTHVTSHLIFSEICDLFDLISVLERNTNVDISLMASKMKMKVGKYWLNTDMLNLKMNKILYIAAILDPRQKMRHVERCLNIVYGSVRGSELTREVRDSLVEMFDCYKQMMTKTKTRTPPQDLNEELEKRSNLRASYSFLVDDSDDEDDDSNSSELTLYLAEKYRKSKTTISTNQNVVVDDFDILDWWSIHGSRFPVLSEMARDILAIPVSTVAFKSAFSTEGRVLDAFKSSLNPSMVEVLICAKDWLSPSSTNNIDEEDEPEEEREKDFIDVFRSMEVGEEMGD